MRGARNLPKDHVPRDIRPPTVSGAFGEEKVRLVALSDALAVACIEKIADVAMAASSLAAMWGDLGRPRPVNFREGGGSPSD